MKQCNAIKSWLILGAVFLFMLLLNVLMPIHRDDYDYSLIWGTLQHVGYFSDVLQSMWNHYLTHGGRMVTVFGLDLFLWLGKIWFDIANAAIFTGMITLLYFHAMRKVCLGKAPWLLALSAFFAWLALPHFGEVAVWKSGSTVYLWSGICVVLFLLPYNLYLAGRLSWGHGMAIPMFFLGILAGWSVENLAVTVVATTFLISAYCWHEKKLKAWIPSGMIGAFVGFIGILAAPGNYVRYGEQSGGKGILIHIGNQFAGNGEMLLYVLPILLLLLLVWRGLKLHMAEEQGETFTKNPMTFGVGQGIILVVLAVVLVSYFSGGWLANGLRDFLITHVLVPLQVTRPKTIAQFSHVMSGLEEMVIYLGGIAFIYSLAKKAMGFSAKEIKALNRLISAKDVWKAYPAVQFASVLFVMALFNNFVMIAAPTFPVRATFSSVCMILVGTLAVLQLPEVQHLFASPMGRIVKIGGGAIGLFLAVSAVIVSYTMTQEHNARIAYIETKAGSGEVVELPPIAMKNRAMRHVFFVDFDNGVTKGGLCHYYGIKDIKLVPGATMEMQ